MRLQPVIQERVDALLGRIQECGEKGETINLKHGFAAYAAGTYLFVPRLSALADLANSLRAQMYPPDISSTYLK